MNTNEYSLNATLIQKLSDIIIAPDKLINKGTHTVYNGSGRMDTNYQITEWIRYDANNSNSGTKIHIIYQDYGYTTHDFDMFSYNSNVFLKFKVIKFRKFMKYFTFNKTVIDLAPNSPAIRILTEELHAHTKHANEIFYKEKSNLEIKKYIDTLRDTENKLSKIL